MSKTNSKKSYNKQIDKKSLSEKYCKVYFVKDDVMYFTFDEYGISAKIPKNKEILRGDHVKIIYSGEFGTPSFKFQVG